MRRTLSPTATRGATRWARSRGGRGASTRRARGATAGARATRAPFLRLREASLEAFRLQPALRVVQRGAFAAALELSEALAKRSLVRLLPLASTRRDFGLGLREALERRGLERGERGAAFVENGVAESRIRVKGTLVPPFQRGLRFGDGRGDRAFAALHLQTHLARVKHRRAARHRLAARDRGGDGS